MNRARLTFVLAVVAILMLVGVSARALAGAVGPSVSMQDYEYVDLALSLLAVLANLGALGFLAYELHRGRSEALQEETRRAREATLNYYVSTQGERNRLRDGLPPQERRGDPTLWEVGDGSGVQRYLTYWETLATGVNLGIYDLTTVNALAGARVIDVWESWANYVHQRRARKSRPNLYRELEVLYGRLRALRLQPTSPTTP